MAAKTATAPARSTRKAVEPKGIEVTLDFVRETPGTYVFKTDDAEAATSTVYLRKASLPEGHAVPTQVTVTIAVK